MSESLALWIMIGILVLGLFVISIAEASWLYLNSKIPFMEAFVFAVLTNLTALTIGLGASFAILIFVYALAWDPNLRQSLGFQHVLDWKSIVLLVAGVLFPLIVLVFAKRLLIGPFGIKSRRPWLFSIVATMIVSTTYLIFTIALSRIAYLVVVSA